jgi:hypothetical protein
MAAELDVDDDSGSHSPIKLSYRRASTLKIEIGRTTPSVWLELNREIVKVAAEIEAQ